MNRVRRVAHFAVALLASAALISPAHAEKADNSVRFAHVQVLPNADPYFNNQVLGIIVADSVWDSLLYRDPRSGAYVGNLATAWRWVDDRTLELDLRQGVKFHNGAAFDADDVVYTLNFISAPENKAVRAGTTLWIDRVEKIDRFKVRIVAKRVFPAALAYLGSSAYVIHPHEYYAKVGPLGVNEKPIGTGPYRVVEHALGKYIRLERNREYSSNSPKTRATIQRVEIRFIPDAQTQVAEMVAGGLDLIMDVGRDQAEQLRDLPRLQIRSTEAAVITYLQMNTLPNTPAPQLRDIRVRRAIMHAIDRETMVEFMVGDGARVLHTECHQHEFGCTDEGAPRYAYDPPKARQLLAEAGLADGFDVDLYAYTRRNEAEAIAGYLAAVGIRARLRFMQVAAARTLVRAGRVPLFLNGTNVGVTPDVSRLLSVNHGFLADDLNRDPDVRDLILSGDAVTEPSVRKQAYAKPLALITERAYVLPLYSLTNYYVATEGLVFMPPADDIPKFYEMSWK